MTGPLKTKSLFILVCILAGFLFQTSQVCRAGFVEKFEPVWEQKPPEPKPARLVVETTPESARVRILNIGPAFSQGMALEPGRYHVEVSAEGFKTEKRWVALSAGEDGNVSIRLTAVRVERPKPVVVQPAVGQKKSNSLGMKFVYIPPGSFMMGSGISPSEVVSRYGGKEEWYKDEHPQHRVTLTKGYYMQTTEVTQGQWERVMGNNPSHFKNCGSNCPVEKVSWEDCQKFIGKLNGMEGTRKYRLPTEAEWEYAARAGSRTRFSWGDDASCNKMMFENEIKCVDYVRSRGLTPDSAAPVKSYSSNSWGLYDMHGNVWEWCQDWYGDYPSGSVTDPTGPSSGSNRVARGGGWNCFAGLCRSADRYGGAPGIRDSSLGFRLAFSAGQ